MFAPGLRVLSRQTGQVFRCIKLNRKKPDKRQRFIRRFGCEDMEKLSNPSKTREIIEKYGFDFRKRFGQNFLVDAHVLERIIEAAQITEEDLVIEIGPGIGSMPWRYTQTDFACFPLTKSEYRIDVRPSRTLSRFPANSNTASETGVPSPSTMSMASGVSPSAPGGKCTLAVHRIARLFVGCEWNVIVICLPAGVFIALGLLRVRAFRHVRRRNRLRAACLRSRAGGVPRN